MEKITWTEVLNIGLPELDEQHKRLFAISDDLLNAIGNGHGEDALRETFDRLKEYTEEHFKAEEAYMNEIKYPDRERHADEHILLLTRVNTLWRLIQSGEIISPKGISLFISDWIVDHIMEKDAAIGKYANSLD